MMAGLVMKKILKDKPDEKIAYLTTDKYLKHQAEKCFKALALNTIDVRTYLDVPADPEYNLFCDEWIEASLAAGITFDNETEWFTGVHAIQKKAKKIYIFGSHYDSSVEKVLKVLHPDGFKVIDMKSLAHALGLPPMKIQNIHVSKNKD